MGKCFEDQLRPCCQVLRLQRKLADVSTVEFNSTTFTFMTRRFLSNIYLPSFTLTLFADGFFLLHNSLSITYTPIRSTIYCVLYIYIPTFFPRNGQINLISLL